MEKPICPACGHELDETTWHRTYTPPTGSPIEYETPMFVCPACTEGFEAPGAAEIVKAVYESAAAKKSV